jgi:hypothetical protein
MGEEEEGIGHRAQLQTQIIAIRLRAKPNHIQQQIYGTTFGHKRGSSNRSLGKMV